jgi:6-phosphogluconolactonase/glucosamine-6-phosphate isomerase/deaminase
MESLTKNELTAFHSCSNPAERAADRLQQYVSTDSPTLFLLAGGSSLDVLSVLSDNIDWSNLTVTVLDERFTDNSEDRNFHQLKQRQIIKSNRSDIHFIDPLPDSKTTAKAAGRRFAAKLEQWLADNPEGKIVATVGIGADGHIAGMLPVAKDVFTERFQTARIAVGYSDVMLDNEFTHRITTTELFFTKHLDHAVAYAVGDSKCPVLQRLVAGTANIHERPAELLKQAPTDLFTDCSLNAGN